MASGARTKFGAPMFKPEVFRKQMYCIEVTFLGLFNAPPCSDSAPGALRPPCPPRYAAACIVQRLCCKLCVFAGREESIGFRAHRRWEEGVSELDVRRSRRQKSGKEGWVAFCGERSRLSDAKAIAREIQQNHLRPRQVSQALSASACLCDIGEYIVLAF